jgi:hypothetical protein
MIQSEARTSVDYIEQSVSELYILHFTCQKYKLYLYEQTEETHALSHIQEESIEDLMRLKLMFIFQNLPMDSAQIRDALNELLQTF